MKENDFDLEELEHLSQNGLSNIEIALSLNISEKSFYNYMKKFTAFTVAIKKGRETFKSSIRSALLDKATKDKDTTALIFLTKRLSLFKNDEVSNVKLKDSTDTLKAFELLYNSNLPLEEKNSLKAILDSFTKNYEITELEKRLNELEQNYNEKYKQQN